MKDLNDEILKTYGTEKASSYITMDNINKIKTRTPSFEETASLGVDRPIYVADLNNSKQERRGARFESPGPTYGN